MARVSYHRVTVSDGGGVIDVRENATPVLATLDFTRPANTTAYTAGDVVMPTGTYGALEITGVSAAGDQLVRLDQLRFIRSQALIGSFTIQLYSENWAGGTNQDNAAVAIPWSANSNFIAWSTGNASVIVGAGSYFTANLNAVMARTDANGSLWCAIIAPSYTPLSGEQFIVQLAGAVLTEA